MLADYKWGSWKGSVGKNQIESPKISLKLSVED